MLRSARRPLLFRGPHASVFTLINIAELEAREPDDGAHTDVWCPRVLKQNDFFEKLRAALSTASLWSSVFERRPSLNICLVHKWAGPDKSSYSPLYTAEGNMVVNSLAFFFFCSCRNMCKYLTSSFRRHQGKFFSLANPDLLFIHFVARPKGM